MVEPVTTVGLGAVLAYLTKDGLAKLLGPTAEYLGDGLKDFTKRRGENINRILQKATEKLGSRIDTPGEVPPRVLKVVLDEGSFCDDELAAEYFGGVLASSRTELGRDDRGARIAKILDGLSTYQIRAHYLIYATVKQVFATANLSLNREGRANLAIFLPFDSFIGSMDFNEGERQKLPQFLTHIFFGLAAEDLIESGFWMFGPRENIVEMFRDAPGPGIVCQPTAMGAELFLWGFGCGDKQLDCIFDSSFSSAVKNLPLSVAGACAVNK